MLDNPVQQIVDALVNPGYYAPQEAPRRAAAGCSVGDGCRARCARTPAKAGDEVAAMPADFSRTDAHDSNFDLPEVMLAFFGLGDSADGFSPRPREKNVERADRDAGRGIQRRHAVGVASAGAAHDQRIQQLDRDRSVLHFLQRSCFWRPRRW